jgi:hypothetical protein
MADNAGEITMDAVKAQKNVQIVVHVRKVWLVRLRSILAKPFFILGCLLGGYRGVTFRYEHGGPVKPGNLAMVGDGPGPEIIRTGGQIMPSEWQEREAPEKWVGGNPDVKVKWEPRR